MAIINDAPTGGTLTRTLAASIIAGLGGNDQQFGGDGSRSLDGGHRHDRIDGIVGNGTSTRAAGNNDLNAGEAAARRPPGAVPAFNVFRPF